MSKIKKRTIKTSKEIMEEFEKKRNKVDILWEALDWMQSYNGRSKTDCVAFAMGYEININDSNCNTYRKM